MEIRDSSEGPLCFTGDYIEPMVIEVCDCPEDSILTLNVIHAPDNAPPPDVIKTAKGFIVTPSVKGIYLFEVECCD